MRKNLFFTLAVAGMLAACSNEELSTPQVENENEPQLVRLSAQTTAISVTKSIGTVGDLEGEKNVWNNQTIYIYSFPKKDPDYTTAPFIDSKKAIVKADNSIEWDDNIAVYFPQKAAYDFFGYHVDDAVANPTEPITTDPSKIYFDNVQIDGSQDLMIAKAELTDAQKETLLTKAEIESGASDEVKQAEWDKAFSAYTARKTVQPNMVFEHLLSRLQFEIYPGIDKADQVFIKSIEVKSRATGQLVVVAAKDEDRGFFVDTNIDPVDLSLKQRDTDGQMIALAQKYYHTTAYDNNVDEKSQTGTAVGESLLVAPQESYDITITMEQNVSKIEGTEDWRETVFPATLKLQDAGAKFLAGSSYLVKITVFGLQEVNIQAQLQGWTSGEDIPLNPDDEF